MDEKKLAKCYECTVNYLDIAGNDKLLGKLYEAQALVLAKDLAEEIDARDKATQGAYLIYNILFCAAQLNKSFKEVKRILKEYGLL